VDGLLRESLGFQQIAHRVGKKGLIVDGRDREGVGRASALPANPLQRGIQLACLVVVTVIFRRGRERTRQSHVGVVASVQTCAADRERAVRQGTRRRQVAQRSSGQGQPAHDPRDRWVFGTQRLFGQRQGSRPSISGSHDMAPHELKIRAVFEQKRHVRMGGGDAPSYGQCPLQRSVSPVVVAFLGQQNRLEVERAGEPGQGKSLPAANTERCRD